MTNLTFDFQRPGIPQIVYAKQRDTYSRFFRATLIDGSVPYIIPPGAVFSVRFQAPKSSGWYDTITEIDGISTHSAFAVEDNAVTVELAQQMLAAPGKCTACVLINDAAGYQLGAWDIIIEVQAVPGLGAPEAADYYNVLAKQIADAVTAAVQSGKDAAAAAKSATAADKSAVAAKASETSAANSAITAKASEDSAAASKAAAKDSEAAAKASETNAASSATAAAQNEADAAVSATAAGASQAAAKASEDNAAQSAAQAANSAASAADIILGTVKSVNGLTPDSDGNVVVASGVSKVNGISPTDGNVTLSAADVGAATAAQGAKADNAILSIDGIAASADGRFTMPRGTEWRGEYTYGVVGLTDKLSLDLDASMNVAASPGAVATALAGKMSMELLWENASPSSAFPTQTIALDLTPYAYLKIVNLAATYALEYWICDCYNGGSAYATTWMHGTAHIPSSAIGQSRAASVNNAGVQFGVGRSTAADNDIYAVPVKIYGVKGGA